MVRRSAPASSRCVATQFIVVEGNYGSGLTELSQAGLVCIVDRPANRAEVEKLWYNFHGRTHLTGGSLFNITSASPDCDSAKILAMIEVPRCDLPHPAAAVQNKPLIVEG